MEVSFGVLGPVAAWDGDGAELALKGPRHRAVLARLLAADGRVVPLDRLVDDLWTTPPAGAVGAVRTFVGDLRRALEPARPPRTPPRLLVTEGPGYALRVPADAVDARRFEAAVHAADTALAGAAGANAGAAGADRGAADANPGAADADRGVAGTNTGAAGADRGAADAWRRLDTALALWRGPAYAGLDEPWAATERGRLAELRLHAVERRAAALLARGRAAEAVPDLDAHAAEHPWREEAWRLLALALYRSGRQADALAVLRQARERLVDQLAIEPGPALRELERDVLVQADHLDAPRPAAGDASRGKTGDDADGRAAGDASRGKMGGDAAGRAGGDASHAGTGGGAAGSGEAGGAAGSVAIGGGPVERIWAETAAAYDRAVAAGSRARLESTVGLLRDLAVTGGGGLLEARRQRVAAVAAAEELGDPELTARVIGAYDVPASWTRVDDPDQAAAIVAAAERTLARLAPAPAAPAPAAPAPA
ncbi:BTAD domain-containing putative transcriptional regulator, partial [Conexibacter sp. CPCC 205762]